APCQGDGVAIRGPRPLPIVPTNRDVAEIVVRARLYRRITRLLADVDSSQVDLLGPIGILDLQRDSEPGEGLRQKHEIAMPLRRLHTFLRCALRRDEVAQTT